jgi:methionine synthase II (cobalamin-independent)
VPKGVELGYHLCYGDYGHEHFVQPKDASLLVEVANAIGAGIQRPVDWIHMPVPRARTDDAYFEPLRNLKLQPGTELILGLVHFTDGVEGGRRRLEAAQRAISKFGIATECGLGRRPRETIEPLLKLHAELADMTAQ